MVTHWQEAPIGLQQTTKGTTGGWSDVDYSSDPVSTVRSYLQSGDDHLSMIGLDVLDDRIEELGGSYPVERWFLISEPFDIENEIVRRAGFGAVCIDVATHLLDDILDEGLESPVHIHLYTVLLNRGLQEYYEIAGDNTTFHSEAESLILRASEAQRNLMGHNGEIYQYSESDYSELSHQADLFKLLPAVYASVNDDWETYEILCESLNHYYIAMELKDDLVDWREDYRMEIYTDPIVRSLEVAESNHPDPVELAEALYVEPALAIDFLSRADAELDQALNLLSPLSASSIEERVVNLQEDIRSARTYLKNINRDSASEYSIEEIEKIFNEELCDIYVAH